MITRIEALGFRSLRDVEQDLAPFQVLVGPNGSGKSTFLDVIGFMGDLLRVGPQRAILGDLAAGVAQRAADPIHLCWMRESERFELAVELEIPHAIADRFPNGKYRKARYEISLTVGLDGGEIGLSGESLWLAPGLDGDARLDLQKDLFPEHRTPRQTILRPFRSKSPPGWRKVVARSEQAANVYFHAETTEWNNPFRLLTNKAALANLPEDESRFPVATWVKRVLMDGVQRVVLNADAMRRPSPPGSPRRYLPDGSNLPWVIENLRHSDRARFKRWVGHVRTALPELRAIETVERAEDRNRYVVLVYENGFKAPCWIVSDGSLRLLALSLIAYLNEPDVVYLVEEPENGIHPRAVETVYQSLASIQQSQVLCASHSPVVLGLARPKDVLCFAQDRVGATDIVRGDRHPRLRDWQGALDLGILFASGVLG